MKNSDQTKFISQSAGVMPSVASIDAVVLYDSSNGRIAHIHHSVTFEGAISRSRKEQKQNAIETARRFGCPVDNLKVLHVPGFDEAGNMFRVDIEKQQLVKAEEVSVVEEYHKFAAQAKQRKKQGGLSGSLKA